jgi:hypothetical protein
MAPVWWRALFSALDDDIQSGSRADFLAHQGSPAKLRHLIGRRRQVAAALTGEPLRSLARWKAEDQRGQEVEATITLEEGNRRRGNLRKLAVDYSGQRNRLAYDVLERAWLDLPASLQRGFRTVRAAGVVALSVLGLVWVFGGATWQETVNSPFAVIVTLAMAVIGAVANFSDNKDLGAGCGGWFLGGILGALAVTLGAFLTTEPLGRLVLLGIPAVMGVRVGWMLDNHARAAGVRYEQLRRSSLSPAEEESYAAAVQQALAHSEGRQDERWLALQARLAIAEDLKSVCS